MTEEKNLAKRLDWSVLVVPLIVISALCILFMQFPEQSKEVVTVIRSAISDTGGMYYALLGVGAFLVSLYMGFSKFGKIKLGNVEKPEYSNFKWGAMIFTSTMAADILFYSCIEWALYGNEPHVHELGSMQMWAPTFTLFHWGPIAWSFYIVLAVCFGFMIHVRKREKQKFSEACRPIFGKYTDKLPGRIIDMIAAVAMLAATATTFSLATPLLTNALGHVFGFEANHVTSIIVLLTIAAVYTFVTLTGMTGVSKLANLCAYLFFVLLGFVLVFGGEFRYILETGFQSLGNLIQNFTGLSTYVDPLRENSFPQNWTLYYWAYWLVWCVGTPFFVGIISKGRTIRNLVFGGYGWGLAGTFVSFIILGNYGLAQEMKHGMDITGAYGGGEDMYKLIIKIFDTLPLPMFALILLVITMIAFYSTTFDALTMVMSGYSYKALKPDEEPSRKVKIYWAILFILFPIALLFPGNTLNNLQSVTIIGAFPVGICLILITVSFFKDAGKFLKEKPKKIEE